MESILTSIKKLLGIAEDYTHFDADLIMHINSVFTILNQLGVGPTEGFFIEDELATWNDFVPVDKNFNIIKSYMHLNVKILFDPPSSSVVMESMNRMISQFEWRINILAEEMERASSKPPINNPSTDQNPPQVDPEEPATKFVVEDISVNDHNIVMQYSGLAPKDVPSLNTSLSDGNLYIDNNGNHDLNFSIRNGMLRVSDEIESTEPDTFEVDSVSIDEHNVVMDYTGEVPDDIPSLNTSLSDGNLYVTNNGNYDMNLSIRNGMLQISDENASTEPDDTENFEIDSVSIDEHNVVIDYTGELPDDIPSLNTSLSDGNVYVDNNGNHDLNFSIRNGMMQISDENGSVEPDDTETFKVDSVSIDEHNVVIDYTGNVPDDIPSLNTSLSDGNLYVDNNGNYNMNMSIRNGMLQISDENSSEEPDDTETFKIDSVSIDEHNVVIDYTGEVPDDIPSLESVLSNGNVYVTNNGNHNMNFSVNDGSLQFSNQ